MKFLILAIVIVVTGMVAAIFGVRTKNSKSGKAAKSAPIPHRRVFNGAICTALVAVMLLETAALGAGLFLPEDDNPATLAGTTDGPSQAEPVDDASTQSTKDDEEMEYADAVRLTDEQLDEILSKYDRTLNKESLASRIGTRTDAIEEYGKTFADPVAMPIDFILDDLQTILKSGLTPEMIDDIWEMLFQQGFSNPVVGKMLVDTTASLSYFTRNNPDLIKYAEWLDSCFDKQEEPIGLDCLLEKLTDKDGKSTGTIITSIEYCRVMAYTMTILRAGSINAKIVTTKSVKNYCFNGTGYDNLSRAITTEERYGNDGKDHQESEYAINIRYFDKAGNLLVSLGINLFDKRVEIFDTSKPTPPAEKPNDPTPPPTETKEDPTYKGTILYLDADTGSEVATAWSKSGLKNGYSTTVESPKNIPGYGAPDRASVTVKIEGKDFVAKVLYKKNQTTRTDPEFTLTIKYWYRGTETDVFDPVTIPHLKEDEYYEKTSPQKDGYTADKPVVSGRMPAHDETIIVWYDKNQTDELPHLLTVKYRYRDESIASSTVTETHMKGDWYSIESPIIKGFKATVLVVEGYMPDGDKEVIVYYDPIPYTLTLRYWYTRIGGERVQRDKVISPIFYLDPYWELSPSVTGWTPSQYVVSGQMPDRDLTIDVVYTKDQVYTPPTDISNPKDPSKGSGPQGNAPNGGDMPNYPSDSSGDYQQGSYDDWEPSNYPEQGSWNDPSTDHSVSTTPLYPNDNPPTTPDSTGHGGQDHPIQDPNGGTTDQGEVPDKVPTETVYGQNVTETNPDGSETISDVESGQQPVNTGTVDMPPD